MTGKELERAPEILEPDKVWTKEEWERRLPPPQVTFHTVRIPNPNGYGWIKVPIMDRQTYDYRQ